MTEDEVRTIVRSELGRMFARAVSEPVTMPDEPDPVAAWVETLPIGEEGRALTWIERYRAETGNASPPTPRTFGRALRALDGRLVSRKLGRTGIYTYTRIALAPAAPPA